MIRAAWLVAALVFAMIAGSTIVLWPSTVDVTGPAITASPATVALRPTAPIAVTEDQPPTVAPRPVAATAPIPRFSSDRDLFATDLDLKRSDRGGDLYVAKNIPWACYLSSRAEFDLRTVATGRVLRLTGAPPTPVRLEAACDLIARCSGFETKTRLELQQARDDIATRVDRADDPVGWGEGILRQHRILSDDVARTILASRDPVAILDLSTDLVERRRKTTHQPTGSDDETQVRPATEENFAMALVSCELAGDCASDGFEMLQNCALQADNCGIDQPEWLLREVSADDRRTIEGRAATFVQAIRDDDPTPGAVTRFSVSQR